jgi:hypothetical protein
MDSQSPVARGGEARNVSGKPSFDRPFTKSPTEIGRGEGASSYKRKR